MDSLDVLNSILEEIRFIDIALCVIIGKFIADKIARIWNV